MNDNKTHISRKDFFRYLKNEMTDSERNAFEKELQKHPFEAEALEGFSDFKPENIENDLNDLQKQIAPVKQKNRFRFMAAAATILLLITAGVIWMQIQTENKPLQTAETKPVEKAEKSIEKYEPVKKQTVQSEVDKEIKMVNQPVNRAKSPQKKAAKLPTKSATKSKTKTEDNVSAKNAHQVLMIVEDFDSDETEINEDNDKFRTAKSAQQRNATSNNKSFSGAAVTAPAPVIAPVPAVAPKEKIIEDSDARPVTGLNKYNAYLDSTAVLPANYKKRKEKIRIKFEIDTKGNPYNFKNINRADTLLFNKACEIIKNGPRWSPEIKDGKQIDSTVELKIVFRKKQKR